MARIYASMEELIGHTPLLRAARTEAKRGLKAHLIVKLESFNPAGSAKDRPAREMLDDAERRGLLRPGATVIEPTSGNTGIGLCAVCAVRGYHAIIVMPDSMSEERKTLMRAYGAELVLTPGALGMKGAIEQAEKIHASLPGSFIAGQFVNPSNAGAHYKTTGPELWDDTDGQIAAFVAGVGTGGTLTGAGRYLKEKDASVSVIAVEPASSPFLSSGKSGAHGIQGIGAGFMPDVLDTSVYDEIVTVTDEDAFDAAREFGRTEGILVGISSGAALCAACRIAARPEFAGKNVVVLLPDSGDRYLSTALYRE